MDPDATLKEMRALAKEFLLAGPDWIDGPDAVHLAELVLALDKWLKKDGVLPRAWQRRLA